MIKVQYVKLFNYSLRLCAGGKIEFLSARTVAKFIIKKFIFSNYSVPNLAISDKAFKTFCPDLIVVSIIDLKTAKPSAPSVDLN